MWEIRYDFGVLSSVHRYGVLCVSLFIECKKNLHATWGNPFVGNENEYLAYSKTLSKAKFLSE